MKRHAYHEVVHKPASDSQIAEIEASVAMADDEVYLGRAEENPSRFTAWTVMELIARIRHQHAEIAKLNAECSRLAADHTETIRLWAESLREQAKLLEQQEQL